MITDTDVREKVLMVGPSTGGGMTAVIESYADMFGGMKFVWSNRPGSSLTKTLAALSAAAKITFRLATDRKIKVVHFHSASGFSFRRKMLLSRIARLFGKKVVMHIHGGKFMDFLSTDPEGIVAALRGCDKVVCLSEDWQQQFSGAGVDNLTVIRNGVPRPTVMPADTDGRLHVLFLGVLIPKKGVNDILEMARANAKKWRGRVVIHIGGDGPLRENLEQTIASQNLGDIIKMEGWVTGRDKIRLLNLCDVYFLPSYIEALPVSIIETMSYGMPVISTPVGGIPSMVKPNRNGFLIPAGDTAGFAAAIDRLAGDAALRQAMGKESRGMSEPYLLDNIKKDILEFYSTIL